jgi:hypothetical protein
VGVDGFESEYLRRLDHSAATIDYVRIALEAFDPCGYRGR